MQAPVEGHWYNVPILSPQNDTISNDGSSTIYQVIPTADSHRQYPNGPRQDNPETFSVMRKPIALSTQSSDIQQPRTDSKTTPSRKHSKKIGLSKRGSAWWLEIAGLILSTLSFIALISVLFHVNGRPLTQWNFIISVNALVSILAAISRTSLAFSISSCLGQAKWNWFKRRPSNLIGFERFDDASRGPWGSVWLIIWLKASHWLMLGAIATILLMTFEPFLQALISFTGQMDPLSSNPSPYIGLSQVLDTGTFQEDPYASTIGKVLPDNTTVFYSYFVTQPDLGMVSAFNSGFYNSSQEQNAVFFCPTANCTWPASTSLAICGACNDVGNHLEKRKVYGHGLDTLPAYNNLRTDTNFTINSLPLINITNASKRNHTDISTSALMVATRITDSQLTLSFQHLTTMITALQVLRAPDDYETGKVLWDNATVTATECALYFCLNTYEPVVNNGVLSEAVISTPFERKNDSYREYNADASFDNYEKWHNYSLYPATGDFNRTDLELVVLPTNSTQESSGDSAGRFRLTQNTVGSTTRFANDQFFAELMYWPLTGKLANSQPTVVQALYHSTNLTETFGKSAKVLSNWMRDVSDTKSNGTTQEWVIHIYVDWPYISLPVISVVVGLGFSLYCMFDTHRLKLDPWKTDTMATLTHSVDAETRAQLRHAYRNGYLEKAVKAMTVKFEDTGGAGYELRAQHL